MGGYCLVAPVAHFNPSSGYSAVATPANRAAPHAPLPMQFKLDHASWDERRRELNVVYEANLNGERKRACEIMHFEPQGRQIRGEALYGAAV